MMSTSLTEIFACISSVPGLVPNYHTKPNRSLLVVMQNIIRHIQGSESDYAPASVGRM